jgi:hypothetical protein
MKKFKFRCVDDSPHNDIPGATGLVLNQVYEAETDSLDRPVIHSVSWAIQRFEMVKDDEDYEPVPITLKSPTRGDNNEVDSQELMDFFSRPQSGNCKCGGSKILCPYHKGI